MGPFHDRAVPRIGVLTVEPGAAMRGVAELHGHVDIEVVSSDEVPLPITGAPRGEPVAPTVLRWRLGRATAATGRWRTAVDFRTVLPGRQLWSQTYTPGTRQNRIGHRGYYELYLVRRLDTSTLADGPYELEVAATDLRGNTAFATFALVVANRH